jgi:ribonuclease HII
MASTTAKSVVATLAEASFEELPALIQRHGEDPRAQVKTAVKKARRRLAAWEAEKGRVGAMYAAMREYGGPGTVVGIDEVGRGAVAGPLTVCAVVLPDEPQILGLNDSKQLSPKRREELAAQIRKVALAIGICHIEPASIDACGMAASLRMAMLGALEDTHGEPDAVLIDGNPVHIHEKEIAIVKGDAKIACIAAASIVAKVTRDAMMVEYDAKYPGYHLAHSKGYASQEHRDAIAKMGLTDIHRVSFCGNFLETPRLF